MITKVKELAICLISIILEPFPLFFQCLRIKRINSKEELNSVKPKRNILYRLSNIIKYNNVLKSTSQTKTNRIKQ